MNACGHNEQGGVIVQGRGILCGSCAFFVAAQRHIKREEFKGLADLMNERRFARAKEAARRAALSDAERGRRSWG